MNCPKCKEPMENLGNVSGITLTSYPPQWDEVYVCRKDKVKKTVRVHAQLPPDNSFVNDFKEIKT